MIGGISGVDIQDLVDGLMVYQRQGLVRMNQQQDVLSYQKSSYTELRKFLTAFQTSFMDFQTRLNHHSYKAESLDENIVSVAASGGKLASGTYDINVSQVASAHQVASSGFSEGASPLALDGDLTIEVAGNSMTLNVSANDSLESIRDKINSDPLNPGVTASILKVSAAGGGDEYRLVFTSEKTGSANSISVSGVVAADLDLSNELRAAQNAIFTFNGFSVERDSNHVTDLMDGLSFHLNGKLGSTTISIKEDNVEQVGQLKEQFRKIIEDYNQIMEFLARNKAHPSLRDSTYSIVQNALQSIMRNSYGSGSGSLQALFELGVSTDKARVDSIEVKDREGKPKQIEYAVTGLLRLDDELFDTVFTGNIDAVRSMFNDDGGFIKAAADISAHLETETIVNRETIIDEQSRRFSDRIFREENRLQSVRAGLVAQYTQVEKIISNYEMMGNFLEKQLDAMSGKWNK